MRAILIQFVSIFLALRVEAQSSGMVECFRCTANNTNCRETCMGMYCYKTEFISDDATIVKRGCLNRKDELSKVGQCTSRPATLPGGTPYTENFCICQADRCNGASSWYSSMTAFFAAAVAYFWKD